MSMNKRCLFVAIFAFFLSACAHGPVYTAKNEGEAIKTGYQDKRLQEINSQNQALLKEIYARFTAAKIDFYKEGLGFTDVTSEKGIRMYYLMVKVRPQEIMYKEMKGTSDERFSEVIQKYAPKYLKYMKKSDLDTKSIEGLTFGEVSNDPAFFVHISTRNLYFAGKTPITIFEGVGVPRKSAGEMRVGPSKSACRSRLQTTLSCIGKELLW